MNTQSIDWRRSLLQILVAGLFAAGLGYCSNRPGYQHLEGDQAVLKLSLRHAGQILGECYTRTPEELADLPANMRTPMVCPRERSPLVLELRLNDELVLSEVLPARGLHNDGRASAYHRLVVPVGRLDVAVRLKDHVEKESFQYQARRSVEIGPRENLVIDFNSDLGEFEFLLAGELLPAGPLSDQRTSLEHSLDDLEARDRQRQDDEKVDETPVREGLAAAHFDDAHHPVSEEIEADGNDGEKQNLTHGDGA